MSVDRVDKKDHTCKLMDNNRHLEWFKNSGWCIVYYNHIEVKDIVFCPWCGAMLLPQEEGGS